jgi:hypothetical protein
MIFEPWHDRNIDFNSVLRGGCKVFCVSQDAENAEKLDFSQRSYGKPRMWAQYGGNHSGDAFQLSGDDFATLGLETVLHRHRDKHMHPLFFRKDKDWKAESEYRWIIRGETNEPEFIPIEHVLRASTVTSFTAKATSQPPDGKSHVRGTARSRAQRPSRAAGSHGQFCQTVRNVNGGVKAGQRVVAKPGQLRCRRA